MKFFGLSLLLTALLVQPSVSHAGQTAMKVTASKTEFSTSDKVGISWTSVSGATKYGLTVWKAPYGSKTYSDGFVTGTSKDLGKLSTGKYRVIMRPYGITLTNKFPFVVTAPIGPASSAIELSVLSIPGTTTMKAAKLIFDVNDNAAFNWTASSNATRYSLTVLKTPLDNKKPAFGDYVTGTSKSIGKLPVGKYQASVTPYDSTVSGSASNSVSFEVVQERYGEPSRSDTRYYSSQNTFYPGYFGNCTWYAFGRAWEISKTRLLFHGNAQDWWYNSEPKLSKNSTPDFGAVAVWGDKNHPSGHVAVVEEISSDAKGNQVVTVSEGNYSNTLFHRETVADITKRGDAGKFLGYIHTR